MSKAAGYFRENLRRLLERHNFSQNQFAAKVGLTGGNLSNMMTGKNDPGLDTIEKIADYWGLSAAEMLSDPRKTEIKPRTIEPTPLEAWEIVGRALRGNPPDDPPRSQEEISDEIEAIARSSAPTPKNRRSR